MGRYDDELQALVDTGRITEQEAEGLRDASSLKAERDQAKAEADATRTRLEQMEARAAADVFTKLGVPGAPSAYNLPADVDKTNEDQVASWARSQNLIAAAGPTDAEREAHERMTNTTAGSAGTPTPPGVGDKIATLHRQIKKAGARQLEPGGELYQQTINALSEAGMTFDQVQHDGSFERIPEWGSQKA